MWLGVVARAGIYLELVFVSTEGEVCGVGLAMGDWQHVTQHGTPERDTCTWTE